MRILKLRTWILAGVLSLGISSISTAQSAKINIQQNEMIPQLLDLKFKMEDDGNLGERYKIQLYSGDNNTASEVIKDFRSKYSEWPSNIIYETPNYKVLIGKFRNRLEADRAMLKIKDDFPSAFVPKPQRG
ncbi:MAG: SPOR domain-containing protein [Gillisia sp.]